MIKSAALVACFSVPSLIFHWWAWGGDSEFPNVATFALVVISYYYIMAFFWA